MNTKEDVLAYIEEEGVKFIRLAYFDLHGKQKNVSVMPGQLARVFEKGITVDGSQVFDHEGLQVNDLILKPDPSTMTILPWRSMENGVICLICDLQRPDGTPFEGDMRGLLKRSLAKAQKAGLDVLMASKFQFYLLEDDPSVPGKLIPFDQGSYMDVAPLDQGENIRREICLILEEMGFDPHKSYHQEGPGQNEIDFHFSDPLSAADEASLFRWVVQTCAANNGLHADFSPAPLENCPGSALHIQIRFFNEDEKQQKAFTAGILRYLPVLQAFFNPQQASYRRLSHPSSPKKADYSGTKRNVMLRKPPLGTGVLEIRLADSDANPYLTFALALECGLYGIANDLSLDESADPAKLADSLEESIALMEMHADKLDLLLDETIRRAFFETGASQC